jgi:hypothetical protein
VLNLIGYACKEARQKPLRKGGRLLTPQDLWSALQPTSVARAREVGEEFAPVMRLESLRGEQVLLDRNLVVDRLDRRLRDESSNPRISGETVLDELTVSGFSSSGTTATARAGSMSPTSIGTATAYCERAA